MKKDITLPLVTIKDLERTGADSLFQGLLSDSQLEEIQQRRIKKAKIKSKKIGKKVKVIDVKPDEYILKDGGFTDEGSVSDDFDIVKYMNDAAINFYLH